MGEAERTEGEQGGIVREPGPEQNTWQAAWAAEMSSRSVRAGEEAGAFAAAAADSMAAEAAVIVVARTERTMAPGDCRAAEACAEATMHSADAEEAAPVGAAEAGAGGQRCSPR